MAQVFRAVRRDCALADESRAGMVSVGRGARFCNGYSLTKSCLEGVLGLLAAQGTFTILFQGLMARRPPRKRFMGQLIVRNSANRGLCCLAGCRRSCRRICVLPSGAESVDERLMPGRRRAMSVMCRWMAGRTKEKCIADVGFVSGGARGTKEKTRNKKVQKMK